MIGLSPLPSPHPEAFQRLSVRPSIDCHADFSLDKGRSPGFAFSAADLTPSSGSLSLRLTRLRRLTSPATLTRRLIMQKARRHPIKGLRPLVGARVQDLFHSPRGVLFTFPSRYYALSVFREYLALRDGPRRFRPDFSCPAVLRDRGALAARAGTGMSPSSSAAFQPPSRPRRLGHMSRPYYPAAASTAAVWAPPLSLAATRGIDVSFSSCGYWDVSVPRVRPPFGVRALTARGLPHSDTPGSSRVCRSPGSFAARRVLRRLRKPRHPPCALFRFAPVSRAGVAAGAGPRRGHKSPR